jgi:hypothetical protein
MIIELGKVTKETKQNGLQPFTDNAVIPGYRA